mgnify:CR=1 FL=1
MKKRSNKFADFKQAYNTAKKIGDDSHDDTELEKLDGITVCKNGKLYLSILMTPLVQCEWVLLTMS